MIPRDNIIPDAKLPEDSTFWVPSDADESLGYFHDTWPITDVMPDDARSVVAVERRLVSLADRLTSDAHRFDEVMREIEYYTPDAGWDEEDEVEPELDGHMDELWDCYSVGDSPGGLDVGVAGLVLALASIGVLPAASCRGHFGPSAWSPHPVVYLAADRAHAEWLEPLVFRSGCGFCLDSERSDLLCITAPSVLETMNLALDILDSADTDWPAGLSRQVDFDDI